MTGVLRCIGVGPGDPELMTIKAARLLWSALSVAYFAKRGSQGHARRIAASYVRPDAEELRFEYPYTTEIPVVDARYEPALTAFYEESARRIAERLDVGQDVALLCEGDPFFYGSAMHLFDRLASFYPSEVVPGVTGMSGCWSEAKMPMTHGDDVLTVLPGTLGEQELASRLAVCDAAAIMKVGSNLPKIRAALDRAGLAERAVYVARGTMTNSRVMKLADLDEAPVPYFSIILVPGRQHRR